MTGSFTAGSAKVGILLSRSTTTGWLDWMHGELWLFEDGILRVPLGWMKTLQQSTFLPIPEFAESCSFDIADVIQLTSDQSNVWIPKDALVGAELRYTMFIGELRARLAEGRSIQLLWLPRDGVFLALQEALSTWLGDRLVIRLNVRLPHR